MATLLTETIEMTPELIESKGDGKIRFRGKLGIVDEATANGRFYRKSIMEREINRIGENIRLRGVFGELDHPDDGRTRLTRASHIITNLSVVGGDIVGEVEVLSTPNGKILEALARDRVRIGMSLRGFGSTERKECRGNMIDEVGDDFRLETFDVVYNPAAYAYPQLVSEANEAISRAEENMDIDTLKRDYPGLYEEILAVSEDATLTEATLVPVSPEVDINQLRKSLRAEVEESIRQQTEAELSSAFADKYGAAVRTMVEGLAEKAMRRARSEALSDPAVAGAKQAINEIARLVLPFAVGPDISEEIRRRDEKITAMSEEVKASKAVVSEAQAEVDKYARLAIQASYTLRVEQASRGVDEKTRNRVSDAVGDVTRFETLEDLEAVLTSLEESLIGPAREAIANISSPLKLQVESLREQLNTVERAKSAMAEASEQTISELRGQLEAKTCRVKAIAEMAERAAVEAFAEGVSRSHPRAADLRVAVRAAKTLSEANQVAAAFDGSQTQVRDLNEDDARQIRAQVGRGMERDPQFDTHGGKRRRVSESMVPLPGIDVKRFDAVTG